MIRNPDRRITSGPSLAILLLLGLIAIYPLSVGPVAGFIFDAEYTPYEVNQAIHSFYWPLRQLPMALLKPLDDWVHLCGGTSLILDLPPRFTF